MLSYVSPGHFQCDGLIIGSSLGALDYAEQNNLPVLTNGKVVYFNHEVDSSGKKLQDEVANRKILLSLQGKLLFPFCEKIYLKENYFSIITGTSSQKLYFNKVLVFDPEEIENLQKKIVSFDVVDIIKKRYLLTPDQKVYYTGDDKFITKIEFGKQNLVYAYSKLSKRDLSSHDYTEFMAKRKLGWWFKKNNFKSHVKGNVTKLYHYERLKRACYDLVLPDNLEDRTNG
mgnify:FL=1